MVLTKMYNTDTGNLMQGGNFPWTQRQEGLGPHGNGFAILHRFPDEQTKTPLVLS